MSAELHLDSLKLAEKRGLRSIAFPAISTGAYGYPVEEAAKIAVQTVKDYLNGSKIKEVIFVTFRDDDYEVYKKTLEKVRRSK